MLTDLAVHTWVVFTNSKERHDSFNIREKINRWLLVGFMGFVWLRRTFPCSVTCHHMVLTVMFPIMVTTHLLCLANSYTAGQPSE